MSLLLCQMLLLHDARLVCSVLCGTKVRNILTLFMKLAAHYVLCCSDLGLIGCLLLLAMLPRGGGGEGGGGGGSMMQGLTECAHTAVILLQQMPCNKFYDVQCLSHFSIAMLLHSHEHQYEVYFAPQRYMQDFNIV